MRAFFALVTLAAGSAFAATDPSLLGLVMPDAKVVTGIQVTQSQASPFGQYILSQVKSDANLDKLMAAIGFDLKRDLKEIVAATSTANAWGDSSDQQGLILGRGTFQPARMAAAATLSGATNAAYKGFQIMGSNITGKNGGVVFLDANTVALGDVANLKAMIDRKTAGKTFSGSVADEAKQMSSANDAWFVSSTPGSFLAGKVPAAGGNGPGGFSPGNLLQSVVQTGGGAKFTPAGVLLSLEALTNSNQDAQSLADVLRFLVGMVQTNRGNNPGASKAPSIADTATFTANGPLMRVTATLPEQQVEQLLMPSPPAATPKKVATR